MRCPIPIAPIRMSTENQSVKLQDRKHTLVAVLHILQGVMWQQSTTTFFRIHSTLLSCYEPVTVFPAPLQKGSKTKKNKLKRTKSWFCERLSERSRATKIQLPSKNRKSHHWFIPGTMVDLSIHVSTVHLSSIISHLSIHLSIYPCWSIDRFHLKKNRGIFFFIYMRNIQWKQGCTALPSTLRHRSECASMQITQDDNDRLKS